MAILHSAARHAAGVRQQFIGFSSPRQSVPTRSYLCWTRAMAFAFIASLAWFALPTAQAQSASSDARLSTLSLLLGNTFSNIFFPQLGEQLTLTPAFKEEVKSYTASIRYDVTDFSLILSRNHPESTIEVTGIGSDGAPLKIGARIESIGKLSAKSGDREMVLQAAFFQYFYQVPLGKNTITVQVTSEDGSTTRTTTITVVRLDPDMND